MYIITVRRKWGYSPVPVLFFRAGILVVEPSRRFRVVKKLVSNRATASRENVMILINTLYNERKIGDRSTTRFLSSIEPRSKCSKTVGGKPNRFVSRGLIFHSISSAIQFQLTIVEVKVILLRRKNRGKGL